MISFNRQSFRYPQGVVVLLRTFSGTFHPQCVTETAYSAIATRAHLGITLAATHARNFA